jgi:CIC family chloride channel protein
MPIYDALLLQDGLHLPHAHGHALRRVQAVAAMIREVDVLEADWTVDQARARLAEADGPPTGHAVVDAGGRLVGMLETAEIARAAQSGNGGRRLGELARPAAVHAHPDHSLDTVLVKLGRLGACALPVVSRKDTKKLLGVVTVQSIAAAMARADGSESG